MGLAFIPGLMGEDMKVNGWKTIWRAWEFTFGTMGECIKASIRMIKSTATVSTLGLMAAATKVIGIVESSTDLEHTSCPKTKR